MHRFGDGNGDLVRIFQNTLLAHGKNDILAWWQKVAMQPKELPDNPFHPVAEHRFFNAMHTDAEPIKAVIIININQAEMRPPQPFSLSIYNAVLGWLSEESGFRQFKIQAFGSWCPVVLPQDRPHLAAR